jgi:protease IV
MSNFPPSGPTGPTPPNSAPWPPPPPGVPPQAPWPTPAGALPPRESRGVSFYVAIFLGLLLLVSAGLNVLLLLMNVGSLAGGGLGGSDGTFDEAHVAGDRDSRTKVLQIGIRGAIAEGANPVLGASGGTVSQVKRALKLAADDDVAGLLLYIDSPGGGVTDSDVIYQAIRRFKQEHPTKPVLAQFGDIAASGGYYIAVAADHILAPRTGITGSIGVIMSAWNFTEAAKKVGVEQVAIKSARTPYKDMLSPTRPLQPAEHAMLLSIVDELFDQFVSVVDEGRPGLDRDGVLRAATGAVYTASQAKELGLVDEIGDQEAALAWFRERLKTDVAVVELRRRPSFSDLLFQSFGQGRPAVDVADLLTQSTGPRFLYFWQGGR